MITEEGIVDCLKEHTINQGLTRGMAETVNRKGDIRVIT